MYVKRILLENVGPIHRLDIPFAAADEGPVKPAVFVGGNGSGKSILLSYIVNGLLLAQNAIYENSELKKHKVYKFSSSGYIKSGEVYTFGKVEFEQGLGYHEWCLHRSKDEFEKMHSEEARRLASSHQQEWANLPANSTGHTNTTLFNINKQKVEAEFNRNCILYFPANRFEEPAWLNRENLKAQAKFLDMKNIIGQTNRRIINYAPLHDNQNWLLGVVFDNLYYHEDINTYNMALIIVREIMRKTGGLQLGLGKRQNRSIFLVGNHQVLVPNIFQLSTGETALLNLFLSILRDYDLSKAPLTKLEEIRGIVIVDEIDLHLHAIHQYEVLPALMRMFPRVQFVVTSHSPLFVLGLQNVFGADGFDLFQMPDGRQIEPEQFQEFVKEYHLLAETELHTKELRKKVEESQQPILFVEGTTDISYLEKAASLLKEKAPILKAFQLEEGEGCENRMKPVEKALKRAEKQSNGMFPSQKVVFLYDCDVNTGEKSPNEGKVYARYISLFDKHPIKKGIENLFPKTAIQKAYAANSDFIVITSTKIKQGEKVTEHQEWDIGDGQKTNLCKWLCEHGTADDFQHFKGIFDMLVQIHPES